MCRGHRTISEKPSGRGSDCFRNEHGSRSSLNLIVHQKIPSKEKPKENLPFSPKKTQQ